MDARKQALAAPGIVLSRGSGWAPLGGQVGRWEDHLPGMQGVLVGGGEQTRTELTRLQAPRSKPGTQ